MLKIEGFSILEEVSSRGTNSIYRAVRLQDGRSCFLKTANETASNLRSRARISNEYEIGRLLDGQGAAHYESTVKVGHRLVLVIEDFDAMSLRQWMEKTRTIAEKLELALLIAQQLSKVHEKGIVHKDLKPDNILVNPATREVRIIDFGLSVRIKYNGLAGGSAIDAEGSPAYLPPEQTGRVNLGVDFRSDIYALGITLFELFAGRLPFQEESLKDLVYAHIAKTPPRLSTLIPDLPQCIDKVVLRMIQKSPTKRYQSIEGLMHDLEECQSIFHGKASDDAFEPARNDLSAQFVLSQRLVGREAETIQLTEAFRHAVNGGKEVVLISGAPGSGKSVLVRDLMPVVALENGLFLNGKFDQQRGGTPYRGIVDALREFAAYLLRQNEQHIRNWGTKIQETLGVLTPLLIDLVPEFELVVGQQTKLPDVPPEEAQARILIAMRELFQCIASEQQPLMLFIDDLQWADAASIRVIESLVLDDEIKYLLLIVAYREEAANENLAMHQALNRISKSFTFKHIPLRPLGEDAIEQLLVDSFPRKSGDLKALSATILAKTAGNPFFVMEFLGNLHDKGLFYRESAKLAWQWDIAAIQKTPSTGNVIEYLCERVNRLDPTSLELLKLGACLGSRFELATLAFITGESLKTISESLEPAMIQNFVVAEDNGLAVEEGEEVFATTMNFVHDRVREAVYSLIDDSQKAVYHLRIGETALKKLDAEAIERNIFEIVTHLDIGVKLLDTPEKRANLAELNLRAARKAMKAAAFSVAMGFVESGIALLPPDAMETQYETAFGLRFEHSALLFLLEDRKAAAESFSSLIGKARSRLEKLNIHRIHVRLLVHTGDFKQCEELGAQAMNLFGIKVPPTKKLKGAIFMEIIKAKFGMMGKTEAKLLAMPRIKDKEIIALLEFLADFGTSQGASNPELFIFAVIKGFNLTLKHGISDAFPYFMHLYGLINLMAFGNHKDAYKFSYMGVKTFETAPHNTYRHITEFGFHGWIAIWNDDLRPFPARYAEIKAKALEYGDMLMAALSGDMRLWNMSLTGHPLSQMDEECNHHLAFLKERSEDQSLYLVKALLSAKESLVGHNPHPWSLDSDTFDFQDIRGKLLERGAENVLGGMYTKWMQLLFLFDRQEELPGIMEEGHRCIEKMANTFVPTEYYLYETLIMYRLLENKAHPAQATLKKQLAKNLKMVALWEKRCPLNFTVFHTLLRAEQARLDRQFAQAESGYEKAVAIAEEKNWTHLGALANELAGRHHFLNGKQQVARVFLEEARLGYLEWGAAAKVKALEAQYKDILPRLVTENRFAAGSLTASSGRISIDIDLSTILESSQIISSQIKLEGLLRELMSILIKNAGAEKGYFLLYRDNRLFVEAKGDAGMATPEVVHDLPVFGKGILPESVVHYVDHKRETVILENAQQDLQFGDDAYFKAHRCQSVMAVPVVKEGRLLGIIYLENNQAPGVFTPDRVQLVQMLSGQIAVSIDNALVYENLESIVVERTQEIRRQKDELERTKDEIERKNVELGLANEKADKLLKNILPEDIAEELKTTGKAKAQRYKQATVMFTDIVGFTKIAENMSPEELVEELDICFTAFDLILRKFGLEKVKTIGDAYMCMAGVPQPSENSPVKAVLAGLEMQEFMVQMAEERKELGAQFFEMRLGMHSGEIVAGVVGKDKFAYDIWGDTVNLAARLESAGVTGKVNISEETFHLVKDYFECQHRGKISVKNKEDVNMYFVTALKEPAVALLGEIEGNVLQRAAV